MSQHYSDPSKASDQWSLPDLEVFYRDADDAAEMLGFIWNEDEDAYLDEDGDVANPSEFAGWYWWSCFPGCLPDSEPSGPFATKAEALEDARSTLTEE